MTNKHQTKKLHSRIRAVWRREQLLNFTAGVLAFCRWGILLFLAAMAIDWLTYMPAAGRVVIFVTFLAVVLYKTWQCGWRQVRAFNAAHTALRIEEHVGGLESLLVTAVQFRATALPAGTSASLCDATCRKAEQSAKPLRARHIVSYGGLLRPLTALLILTLVMGIFAVFGGPFLTVGIARIFPPWLSISYPTRTQLDMKSGDMIVQEGNSALIKARVLGVIPSEAELELRTGTGNPRQHSLKITDGVCQYTVKAAFRGFEYRIVAGDAWSVWHNVEVISSPRIKQAKVSLEFPPYTKRPTETVEALTITVPEQTTVKWKLTLDRAVSKAEFTAAGGKSQPIDVSSDGLTVTMQQVATQSRSYSFSWVEREHGFFFKGPDHYLQVAPDQAPRVEFTSPKSNLYATLGRKLELAFRGRDDHGIGTLAVGYRVDKLEEEKVNFPAPTLSDGSEQRIDWDYRSVLPDLAVGDTVSFVIELTDRYPGAKGPHLARSHAKRISFLSREDYLAHVAKQKKRLMSQLLGIYREERKVHEVVRNLDPSDDVFTQSCQLEAVRQDLMRGRLNALKQRMLDLIEDLAANNITDEAETATLVQLSSNLKTVAKEHVGSAASGLRDLAVVSTNGAPDPAPAVNMVDKAARELGCLVIRIGFREATEVMARELHAIAQAQASLRLQTIMTENSASDERTKALSESQDQLAGWITRLLGTTPRDKESTIKDALIAFNLSRLVKKLRSAGADTKMREAVALIRKAKPDDAARLQADVIRSLLHAEFRLRIGAEYEALLKADDLFMSQANDQKTLREASAKLTAEQFKKRRSELGQAQAALHLKLQLLLMPAIPAPRPRLFDIDLPLPPPVDNLLAAAEGAMEKAAIHIAAGDKDKAAIQQRKASGSFEALAKIVRQRIEALAERERMANVIDTCGNHSTEIELLEARQLSLIEKTEDAAADGADPAYLAALQQKLVDDIENLKKGIVKRNKSLATPSEDVVPLLNCLDRAVLSTTSAAASLKGKQPDQAITHQNAALDALANAVGLLAGQTTNLSAFYTTLNDARTALRPGPYVADIQAEQLDLVVTTREAKPADLPILAITQKNLVHAVNAVLDSLEVLSHRIESGTVMLFAKNDMEAAGIAIQDNDLVEAEDAQIFVAESLGDLLVELQKVTPQYGYILEVTEFFHEIVPQGMIVRAAQSQLREKTLSTPVDDKAAIRELVDQQRALQLKAEAYGDQLHKATGLKSYGASAEYMSTALSQLNAGDRAAAVEQMKLAEDTLGAETEQLLYLMELLSYVLKPLPPDAKATPEALIVLDMLALASGQEVLYRKTQATSPKEAAELAAKQLELAKRGELLAKRTQSHAKTYMSQAESAIKAEYASKTKTNPNAPSLTESLGSQRKRLQDFFANSRNNLLAANKSMSEAAAKLKGGAANEAVASQHESGELLRHFLVGYVNEFLVVPGPAPPEDPVPMDPVESLEDDMTMFMPGVFSGAKPKGGRQEWEPLGHRDRAALNENFARELPLEYRAILKDYYERLAQ